MNILDCTIKMKKEAGSHYEQLAAAAAHDELKRLFSLLAAAEAEHVGKLEIMKRNMEKLHLLELDRLEESVCVYSPHIDPRRMAEELRSDPDAYRHVVEEERETIEFFEQLEHEAGTEQLKRICRLQAKKEREHLAMLENIYFFVEEPKTYLEWGEFSNLKSL